MNAREELLRHINNRPVDFVQIEWRYKLAVQGTLSEVLPHLDFDYEDGFGSLELYGVIWFADGTWSSRAHDERAEWWEHHARPELPADRAFKVLPYNEED